MNYKMNSDVLISAVVREIVFYVQFKFLRLICCIASLVRQRH